MGRKATTLAFASDLSTVSGTPTAGSGGSETFALQSYPGPGKAIRMMNTSTVQAPKTLEFSHRVEGAGTTKRYVRTATARWIKVNATTGARVEGSCTFSVRLPEDSTVSQTDVDELLCRMGNLLIADATSRGRFIRGEV